MKRKKTVDIFGVPVTEVSDEEAEQADFVVCALEGPSPFTDNFRGYCWACGTPIMYRWHAPRKPRKICIGCAVANDGALLKKDILRK